MYDKFKDITGFDLEDYYTRFIDFINNKSQSIIDYYSGLLPTLDRNSFAEYESLLEESGQVIDLFDLNMERFKTVDFWQLMEFADDIRIKLETIGNFSKYARSSVSKESFVSEVSVETPIRASETIEELMSRYGSTDRDNDWVNVAISNSLIQEDYNSEGGAILKLNFKNNSRFFINSVVDNPEGEKIKGKDVDNYLQFVNEDLKILGYEDTLQQSINTLMELKKNDNPEFPQFGVDPSLIIGKTFKSIAIPSVVRQIYQTFSTDDVIKEIQIVDTEFSQDAVIMSLSIAIKSGEAQIKSLSIGN